MRIVVVVLLGLGLLKSFESQGQSIKSTKNLVTFDPLFWKDELRLNPNQYMTIQNINKDFYEAIYRLVNENEGNVGVMQSATSELLQHRSVKIWNTFHPKQKRKWKKLSGSNAEAFETSFSRVYLKVPRLSI